MATDLTGISGDIPTIYENVLFVDVENAKDVQNNEVLRLVLKRRKVEERKIKNERTLVRDFWNNGPRATRREAGLAEKRKPKNGYSIMV